MNEDGILCNREEDLLPIKDYDDWRIPFIGRRVNEKFWEKFQKQDDLLKDDPCAYLCLEKTGEALNRHDSEYHLHSLKVYLEKEKNGDGFVIKSLLGCHYTLFSTDSNWRDMHERHQTYYVCPDDIEKYIEILDPCTEEIYDEKWHDFILGLFLLVKSTDNRFANYPIEKNSYGYFIFAGVHSAQMAKLLSYSQLFLEPFFVPHYARSLSLFLIWQSALPVESITVPSLSVLPIGFALSGRNGRRLPMRNAEPSGVTKPLSFKSSVK